MSVTIIPATDYGASIAGWEILARSLRENAAARRDQQSKYQELILSLSGPNVTEDQQNAVLTQDPQQFEKFYGVPLSSVGKDVAQFRATTKDLVAPNGMVMNATEPAGSKRVLVPHPGGTPAEQRAQAELTQTQVQTKNTATQTRATEAAIPIAQGDFQTRIANATMDIAKSMRTPDGKVPNYNQRMEYIKGNFDLVPTTDVGKRLESIREILGVDLSTPEGRVLIHDFKNEQNYSDSKLEKMAADIRETNTLADLHERELELLGQGINPKTGKPLDPGINPKEVMQLGEGFQKAFTASFGPLGFPTGSTTDKPWVQGNIPLAGPFSIPYAVAWFTKKTGDNNKLAPAIFGNGVADPTLVRQDLLRAVEPGQRIKTIDFPSFDPKTNRPITVKLTVDEAVPLVTQMRRTLTTTMPPVFAALRQASPQTLLLMVAGNPMIEQMAKAYAPDVAAAIADARSTAAVTDAASARPPTDENLAPLTNDLDGLQKEAAALRQILQGKAAPPPAPAPAPTPAQ